jgi:hypothetical protein
LAKRIPQRQWLRLSLVEKSDHWHHRLLRPRRERPPRRCAAERDELPSSWQVPEAVIRSPRHEREQMLLQSERGT